MQARFSATYPLELESNNPENLKVKVEVIYRARRIPPRTSSARAVLLRFIKDIGVKHILMTLEATICRENGDYFQFPTVNKTGCILEMDLDFKGGKIGQGVPQQKKVGDGGTAGLESKSTNKKWA
jgi:hypothetical protein